MAVASTRAVTITYAGSLVGSFVFNAANNANAPGDIDVFTLASGNNTIPFPTGGTVVQAATIIPPAGNTNTITVKGTNADTGVAIHKTDPTTLALDTTTTTQTSIVLTVGSTISGLRIVWS